MTWDAAQYLRFEDERLRPALDLIARIPHPGPARVVDLGCGAGNALPALAARFPGAAVTGVDGSAAMLAKAAATGFATEQADIATWTPAAPLDVLFSNAALHWLRARCGLFPRLLGAPRARRGALAVQMPAMHAAPLRAEQDRIARARPLGGGAGAREGAPAILEPGVYLRPAPPARRGARPLDHRLRPRPARRGPVVQWAMGTSLRPYLDALDETHARSLPRCLPRRDALGLPAAGGWRGAAAVPAVVHGGARRLRAG